MQRLYKSMSFDFACTTLSLVNNKNKNEQLHSHTLPQSTQIDLDIEIGIDTRTVIQVF